jgi:hypothetical protein
MSGGATAIHGIAAIDLEGLSRPTKSRLRDLLVRLADMRVKKLWSFNAAFDSMHLAAIFAKVGLTLPPHLAPDQIGCLQQLSRLGRPKLSDACKQFGVTPPSPKLTPDDDFDAGIRTRGTNSSRRNRRTESKSMSDAMAAARLLQEIRRARVGNTNKDETVPLD